MSDMNLGIGRFIVINNQDSGAVRVTSRFWIVMPSDWIVMVNIFQPVVIIK